MIFNSKNYIYKNLVHNLRLKIIETPIKVINKDLLLNLCLFVTYNLHLLKEKYKKMKNLKEFYQKHLTKQTYYPIRGT